jgi:hypothetical protein
VGATAPPPTLYQISYLKEPMDFFIANATLLIKAISYGFNEQRSISNEKVKSEKAHKLHAMIVMNSEH